MAMTVKDLLAEGRLKEAIDTVTAEVRAKPRDAGARYVLAQLLCIKGEVERADQQLETLAQQDAKLAPAVSQLRQVIRGEQARRQFFSDGRLPDFLRPLPDHVKLHLEAAVLLREGDTAKAAGQLAKAEELRPHLAGSCGDLRFDDLRDLDDLCACYFEVLTSTGKYYVVPMEEVVRIEFRRPEQPVDLLWRRAQLVVRDGPEGEVYLPSTYVTAADLGDALRLGRETDWSGGDGAPMRGIGQRCFLMGEESVPIMQIEILELNSTGQP